MKDRHNKALKAREAICSMYGTFSDIEYGTGELIKRLTSYYEASNKDFGEVPLAVLIPFNYVTKIIGAGGCLIKELVVKTGAQIRVCSSKDDPYTSEIVVTIDGSNEAKLRGAKAILEKVELFKNGGPILQTGQAWSSDLLNQVKNSIPFEGEKRSRGSDRGDRRSNHSRSGRESPSRNRNENEVDSRPRKRSNS